MASLLPRELLDAVTDHLVDTSGQSGSPHLSLCRSFVAPSQSRLLDTISLRTPHQYKRSGGCRRPISFIPTNSKRGLKSTIEAFTHLVQASPRLLGYVRCHNLYGSPHPLKPRLPPDHPSDWLNSQSGRLMSLTFLPNITPKLRSFGTWWTGTRFYQKFWTLSRASLNPLS